MVAGASNHKNGIYVIGNANFEEPADYEKAISATGYGLFNILLLLAATPVYWTCIFDTTSTPFVLPAAECIFELTLFRKGILVSIVYLGIAVGGIFWDSIFQDVIANRFKKRWFILGGLVVDVICNLTTVFTESYYFFLFLKFVSGFVGGGPLTLMGKYLSEFHAKTYDPNFARWSQLLFGVAFVFPAAIAFNVLPYDSGYTFTLLNHEFETFRVYLMLCSLPPIFGLLTVAFLPESPKHLMEKGKSVEALKLFKKMYRLNSRKSPDSYPVKVLSLQTKDLENVAKKINERMLEVSEKTVQLFSRHFSSFAKMSLLQFGFMLGLNTMRLWVPQLFIMLNNFGRTVQPLYPSNKTLTMCEMLLSRLIPDDTSPMLCFHSHIEQSVYVNSTIIATSTVVFGFLSGFLLTTKSRKIIVLSIVTLIAIASTFAVNWAEKVPYMLQLSALVIVCSRIAVNAIAAMSSDLIPKSLRDVSNMYMTQIGNVAAFVGNLVFSYLLATECVASLMVIGGTMIVCAFVTILSSKQLLSSSSDSTLKN